MAKTSLAKKLARQGDPYVTNDGRVLAPDRDEVDVPDIDRKRHVQPAEFRPVRRISVKELPAPASVMNAVGVIFMYTMLGITDREICELLQLAQDQVDSLRTNPAYESLFSTVLNEFVSADSELIESRLAAYAHGALTRVAHLSANAEEESVQLRASDSILDRAGHTPKLAGVRGGISSNDLRIQVFDGDARVDININTGGR